MTAHAIIGDVQSCKPILLSSLQMRTELNRSSPPADDWELEPSEIAFQEKIASGAFGDLYKGAYCGQEVAIKIVRNVQDGTQQYQEFIQVWLSSCYAVLA